VATASVLIYNGAGLEPWIPSIVAAADNPRLVLVDSSANVSLLLVPPAFQKENRTIDPHIWLNPVLAKVQVAHILKGLIQVNPAIAESIASQTNATLIRLDPIEGLSLTDQALGMTYLLKMQDGFTKFALALNHVGCS